MSAGLPFTKMQGVGNDFVVVEESAWPAGIDWTKVALRICDRKFGVGSDGLLVVGKSATACVRMRMFNPDGTEDMCGNGLRCVVRYAIERGLAPAESGVSESIDGLHAYSVTDDLIEIAMAPPKFGLDDIPVDRDVIPRVESNIHVRVVGYPSPVWVDVVNTGSTHSVNWCDELPDDELFDFFSPLIETAPKFPERTSVMWAVVEGPDVIRLRIWERGAGETLGCGTGACAAAVLARQTGRLETERTRVISKGGTLVVRWSGEADAPVYLAGPAETVYLGTVPAEVANGEG